MANDKFQINFKLLYQGYTLVEILVALGIIGLLFGFGFVSFRDYSRRQELNGTADSVRANLRLAQSSAISGEKPDDPDCSSPNVLTGYSFDVISESEYKIEANCIGAAANLVEINSYTLPSDITISTPSPNPIIFKVLGQGNNIPIGTNTTLTLTQSGTGNSVSVIVTSGGEIQ